MKPVYLVDGVRTPIGSFGGSLAHVRADDLAAHVIAKLLDRHPSLDRERIADVMQSVSQPERVKRFLVLAGPFKLEADELTATLKVRRRYVVKNYEKELAALYEGATVGEVLANLGVMYPGISERICDETGEVRRFVNIYVNGEDVRFIGGRDTKVADGDEFSIVPAIAGGR